MSHVCDFMLKQQASRKLPSGPSSLKLTLKALAVILFLLGPLSGTSKGACPVCLLALGGMMGKTIALENSMPIVALWTASMISMTCIWISKTFFRKSIYPGRGTLWGALSTLVFFFVCGVFFPEVRILKLLFYSSLGFFASVTLNFFSKLISHKRGKSIVPFQSTIVITLGMMILTKVIMEG